MSGLQSLVFLSLCLQVVLSGQSVAAIGALDTEEQFPFVVRISSNFESTSSSCSAVVSTGGLLIGTAAHCIYEAGQGVAKQVTVEYTDAAGATRRTSVRKILYPHGYAAKEAVAFPKAPHGSISDDQYYEHTRLDIAFLVPSERIWTLGYAHWITELLNEEVDENSTIFWLLLNQAKHDLGRLRWTADAEAALDHTINRIFGKLYDLPALIVGYGDYNCSRYKSSECKSDGQRRLARTSLVKSTSGDPRLKAPWIWITGVDNTGSSPLRHGDSGGATFIRSLDGRWFFVGYNSKVGSTRGQSSSLLANLNIYGAAQLALSEAPIPDLQQEGHPIAEASQAWIKKQVGYFVDDVLDVWSSPNEFSIRRTSSLYQRNLSGGYYELSYISRENAVRDKEEFFRSWPVRSFKRSSRPIQIECAIKWKSAVCSAKFIALWKFRRPDGSEAEGQSEIELAIDLDGLTQTNIDSIVPPRILGEKGTVLASIGLVDSRTKVGPISGICGHPHGDYALHRAPDDDSALLLEFLHDSPSEKAGHVGGMSLASEGLSADQCTAGWCKVRFACVEGWLQQKCLARSSDISFNVVGVRPEDPTGLSMRETPGTHAEIVASIPFNGRGILAHYCPTKRGKTDWCLISHNGKSGWVARRYLTRH